LDERGREASQGQTVTNPEPEGLTAVTFKEAATRFAGITVDTPAEDVTLIPAIEISMGELGLTGPIAVTPVPFRESTNRCGVAPLKVDPLNQPAISITRSVLEDE
jgi:hypothetical protein